MGIKMAYAQNVSKPLFSPGDVIELHVSTQGKTYYKHTIEKGQTLYSLSKLFSVPVKTILKINGLKSANTIEPGTGILVPFDLNLMSISTREPAVDEGVFIPVVYEVRPRETLYRIAKVYFGQEVKSLMKRNNLDGIGIEIAEQLIIGWYKVSDRIKSPLTDRDVIDTNINDDLALAEEVKEEEAFADEENAETTDSMSVETKMPKNFNVSLLGKLKYNKNYKVKSCGEVAYWDKTMPDNGAVYVLHKEALVGSFIEIYNPLVKRSVRAKVIGRIPKASYPSKVKLVLSPRAAKLLGAIDRKFNTEIKYLVK